MVCGDAATACYDDRFDRTQCPMERPDNGSELGHEKGTISESGWLVEDARRRARFIYIEYDTKQSFIDAHHIRARLRDPGRSRCGSVNDQWEDLTRPQGSCACQDGTGLVKKRADKFDENWVTESAIAYPRSKMGFGRMMAFCL